MIRLDRLLSSRGYCSRSETQKLIRTGKICIDGKPARRADERVLPRDVTYEGEPLDPGEGLVVMLNKPCGYTCSRDDEGPLVYSLLPPRYLRRNPALVCVGRLDKETSGLLLITDDGKLVHRLTSPRKSVPKIYQVELARPLRGDEAETFASGSMLLEGEDKPLKPAKLVTIDSHRARVVLYEGRYHQVRRMFAAVGNHVEILDRVQIGELILGDLDLGEHRILTEPEVALAEKGDPTPPSPRDTPSPTS